MIIDVADNYRLHADSDIEKYRAESFTRKEPETLAWIQSMPDDVVLWDIGANIGVYAIWAALQRPRGTVYAFEPEMHNYIRLCENIRLNQVSNCIPIHVALTSYTHLCKFYVPRAVVGASGGQVGGPVDEAGREFTAEDVQYVMGLSGSSMLRHVLAPQYVKVDVDGQEYGVIEGLGPLLNDVRSILVEVNGGGHAITERMKRHGLEVDTKWDHVPGHSTARRERDGIVARNVVYSRR